MGVSGGQSAYGGVLLSASGGRPLRSYLPSTAGYGSFPNGAIRGEQRYDSTERATYEWYPVSTWSQGGLWVPAGWSDSTVVNLGDYNFEDGLPSAQGWTHSLAGDGAIAIIADGCRFTASGGANVAAAVRTIAVGDISSTSAVLMLVRARVNSAGGEGAAQPVEWDVRDGTRNAMAVIKDTAAPVFQLDNGSGGQASDGYVTGPTITSYQWYGMIKGQSRYGYAWQPGVADTWQVCNYTDFAATADRSSNITARGSSSTTNVSVDYDRVITLRK